MTIGNCEFDRGTRHAVTDRKGRISGYVVAYDDGKWDLEGDPFCSDLLSLLLKLKLDLSDQVEQPTQRTQKNG